MRRYALSYIRLQYEQRVQSPNEFLCTRCPAQFDSRVGLTNHMKLHGSRKQYACDQCDFSCTNKKTMRHHRKLHRAHGSPKKTRLSDSASSSADGQTPTSTITKAPAAFSKVRSFSDSAKSCMALI